MAISLLVVLAAYALVSWHEKSFLHILTPQVAFYLPALYVLPWIWAKLYGTSGSLYAHAYYYGTTAAIVLTSAIVYSFLKAPAIGWKPDILPVKRAHWICLLLSWLTFLPILIPYSHLLTTPRELYQQTRTGEGIYFFGSAFLLNLAFVFFLFVKQRRLLSSSLFLFALACLTLLHGSKGPLLNFLWLWVVYRVYVDRRRWALLPTMLLGAASIVVFCVVFLFLQGPSLSDLALSVVRYADYPRNAMMVIDDQTSTPHYGMLTLEAAFYGRLPRQLFPSKPKRFGPLVLADRYYMAADWEDIGSPDFNIGVQYADFGDLAILYLVAWAALLSYIAKGFIERLKEGPSRSNYVMVALFAGLVFIPIGITYALPEQLALAYLLALHGHIRFRVI